jgi:hypothetical protein
MSLRRSEALTLLCARSNWPDGGNTTYERDEVPSPHGLPLSLRPTHRHIVE